MYIAALIGSDAAQLHKQMNTQVHKGDCVLFRNLF